MRFTLLGIVVALWIAVLACLAHCLARLAPHTEVRNPQAIHYSAFGNYLVDQDGKHTRVHGHPDIVCYDKTCEIHGRFVIANGAAIIVHTKRGDFLIHKPACDLETNHGL